jgi:hypothetical protein
MMMKVVMAAHDFNYDGITFSYFFFPSGGKAETCMKFKVIGTCTCINSTF